MDRRGFLRSALCVAAQLSWWPSITSAKASTIATPVTSIAFGACARQGRPQPIWDAIAARNPDLFVFLGDNIYGDTRDMGVLRNEYAQLAAKPEFSRFRRRFPIVATWDDHDYGENNADARYPMKRQSKQIFLDFFDEPHDSERRLRDGGIYTSYVIGSPGRAVQLILLDTRYHRAPFARVGPPLALLRKFSGRGPFAALGGGGGTMLGEDQWDWLRRQLKVPAEVRLIATSTPFVSSFTGSETWANLPLERARMIKLLHNTAANGVVFLSGDIHRAEISAIRGANLPYPLWEMTSSGLNRSNMYESFNKNRQGDPYRGHNFGRVEVDWDATEPTVKLEACDLEGETVIAQRIGLKDLQPAAL